MQARRITDFGRYEGGTCNESCLTNITGCHHVITAHVTGNVHMRQVVSSSSSGSDRSGGCAAAPANGATLVLMSAFRNRLLAQNSTTRQFGARVVGTRTRGNRMRKLASVRAASWIGSKRWLAQLRYVRTIVAGCAVAHTVLLQEIPLRSTLGGGVVPEGDCG